MVTKINDHRVGNFDIHDASNIEMLLGSTKADIFYCDPPWGVGAIKMFDTINVRDNEGATSTGHFDEDLFLEVLLQYALKHTNGWVVIEYGTKWSKKVRGIAQKVGLIYCNETTAQYNSGINDIFVFRTDMFKVVDLTELDPYQDLKLVNEIFKRLCVQPNQIGMDLCCGMGFTAQACIDHDMVFVGNELNKKRLSKTIGKLEKNKKSRARLKEVGQ